MTPIRLRRVSPERVGPLGGHTLDEATLAQAAAIVRDVEARGVAAVREHAERLGDLAPGAPLVLDRPALEVARALLPAAQRELLERTAQRIRDFAQAQRATWRDLTVDVPGGRAGHTIVPVAAAGCYAPGGRAPLPSSVLMTVVPARVAGVTDVTVASPRPAPATLAAAAIAGADRLLAVGGAQAVAALACGAGVPRCDLIVGPGNRWVTAAKRLLAGSVAIDMLAGPSELAIVADADANAEWIAADLLAQAEHDTDASPVLIATAEEIIAAVEEALARQLATLPTADTARAALSHGFATLVPDAAAAAEVCNRLAPEHLALHVRAPAARDALVARLRHYGTLFVGEESAEVFGDYGVGPNHVLPTGGTARAWAGLSVFTFLRARTWLKMTPGHVPASLVADAADLARLEGLEAHARSAECRRAGREGP